MILISHRGNLNGKVESMENNPSSVDYAIVNGFDVEVDFWVKNDILYLGHDFPQYKITIGWLVSRGSKLWIHCKNIEAMEYIHSTDLNYFWHDTDAMTLTSKGFIWGYPGKQPINNSIAVMPELCGDDISNCLGVCSDYIQNYKK
jgi:hypothetical protein